MKFRYFICDVFTTERFGGNPLAVLPEAEGLDSATMQRIAREFNFSESTFVFPAGRADERKVRIFTPSTEVPFAGHPNVGTAFALGTDGQFGGLEEPVTVTFFERAGPVPVTIERDNDGRIRCELEAPEALSLGAVVEVGAIAAALSLPPDAIVTATHPPRVASVGLPFVVVEVAGREALAAATAVPRHLAELRGAGIVPDVLLYTQSDDEFDLRARMFAPFDGVPEDPATGSANCALVALLTTVQNRAEGERCWRIAQGVEMGRPSVLEARTRRRGGRIETRIGGYSVLVSEGVLYTG